MIKIKLEHIQPPANCDYIEFNKYSIFFGHDNVYKFKHKTNAELFLNKLNNYINDVVYRLNHIYVEIFTEYRFAWVYIETRDVYTQLITDIESKFNKLYRKINPSNYPYFLHNDLLYLIDLIRSFAVKIEDLNKNKKIYNAYNRIGMLINMLDELSQKVNKPDL